MKKHLLVLSALFLAAMSSTPALANEENSDGTIRLTARPYIDRGMSRDTVLEMLGAPSARLSADVWVYFDFKAVNAVVSRTQSAPAAAAKEDALVLAFTDDRLSLIRACDSVPVRAFLAQQAKGKAPASAIAAK